jgi:hypothetical protein
MIFRIFSGISGNPNPPRIKRRVACFHEMDAVPEWNSLYLSVGKFKANSNQAK